MFGRTNSTLGKKILYSAYFGDGSDGDFTVAAGETVELACAIDQEQIYKQYKNLTIETGGVLKPANRCNGMVLLVQGDLTINGTISVDKCAPLANAMEEFALNVPQLKLCSKVIGGKGGDGGTSAPIANYGKGGIGGAGHRLGGGFAAGGGGISTIGYGGEGGDTEPRPKAGDTIPAVGTNGDGVNGAGGGAQGVSAAGTAYSVVGGNGFGGSGANVVDGASANGNAGDGYAGGAVFIFVGGNVYIGETGLITANGGNGADGVVCTYVRSGGGGGAGGGIIVLAYNGYYENHGTLRANGGLGGSSTPSAGSFPDYINGENGGVGSVLVSTLINLMRNQ